MSSSSNLGDATTNLTSPRAFTPALAKMANIVERLTLLAYARAILAHQALDNIISEICLPIHVVLSRCVRRTTIATCTRDQVRVLVTLPALRRSNDCPYFAFVPDMVPFCLPRKFYILSAHWSRNNTMFVWCVYRKRDYHHFPSRSVNGFHRTCASPGFSMCLRLQKHNTTREWLFTSYIVKIILQTRAKTKQTAFVIHKLHS